MQAKPCRVPAAESREDERRDLHVSMEFVRPGWQRWLGADAAARRTFVIDPLGRDVYERCDGETKVERIVADFAGAHKISVAEAEAAVTNYLKTLMNKGLILMAVPKSG